MWLLPVLTPLARAAAFVYYRITYAGDEVPRRGPVLLVANHPNMLLDPLLVVAASRRPVRFLAKAPLFENRRTSWAVRAMGAIPVYRRQDEGAQMGRNADAFHAVYGALAAGGAVGIFPEGISHDASAIAPLKTGAARIALGASMQTGEPLPIVPIGIVMREKDIFGSEALVVRGVPVAWAEPAPVLQLRAELDHETGIDLVEDGRRDREAADDEGGAGLDAPAACARRLDHDPARQVTFTDVLCEREIE